MIKLFLVEDEYAIREGIKKSVHWEEEGYELVGEAPDGEVALPKILESRPDILITDIKMPFMDGLELSRQVKEKLPDIKIIVLSGFDDFNYAKQAISIGVEEYILKPVTEESLLEVLNKVSKNISRDTEKTAADEGLDIGSIDIEVVSKKPFEAFLRNGAVSEIDSFVKDFFEAMGSEAVSSAMFRQYMLVECMLASVSFMGALGVGKDDATALLGDMADPIRYNKNIEEAKEYITELLKLSIAKRNSISEKKNSGVIEKAKEYIKNNYKNDDMSLNTVAAFVNLSPNHFSSMFRKETGENFIEYLTRVRLEKAADLLVCTNLKTLEVGEQVGYLDPHYFSYIFKKTYGISPKEYRKSKTE